MFDLLTDKLSQVFARLNKHGRLTEKDVGEALREIRLALLEADVHFQVARDLVSRVMERAVGVDVLQSLSPAQHVIKIVHEELTTILGSGIQRLEIAMNPPSTVLLVGLQGSGKTTTAAKLAFHLQSQGDTCLLVAADLHRPAAIQQLVTLGAALNVPTYSPSKSLTAIQAAKEGLSRAREMKTTWAVIDTGGRLHTDEEMLKELVELKNAVNPSEVLLVLDAMTGQEAVRVATAFHDQVGLTGLALTKMDGDARGGAALSVVATTGIPIKFIGIGEKSEDLEVFHPDRLSSRILGMGDILSLIEKAQSTYTQEQAQALEQKIRRSTLDLEDFREQLQQIKKLGSLSQIFEMLPGFSQIGHRLAPEDLDGRRLKTMEAIILSMTPQERRHPEILNGKRRRRIAIGSGTTAQDVNQLINQFRKSQLLLQQASSPKGRSNLRRLLT